MNYRSCLNCTKRCVGCHSTCEEYNAYKEQNRIIYENRKAYQIDRMNQFSYRYRKHHHSKVR